MYTDDCMKSSIGREHVQKASMSCAMTMVEKQGERQQGYQASYLLL